MGPTSQEPPGRGPAATGRRVSLGAGTTSREWACVDALCIAAFGVLREGGCYRSELSALHRARRGVGGDGLLAGPDAEVPAE